MVLRLTGARTPLRDFTREGLQGEHSVSLPQQRDAISRYAQQNGYTVSQWFEERVTAAKRGRPVFAEMLKVLKARTVDGVIIHKIDRSARNLRDWADLVELSDAGVEVLVASEHFDLRSRGGRLSADIQAVVAADYIRNLREETRKGFYGRLKQGYYPLPAPVGYLDCGKAQFKAVDEQKAPLVRRAFELYATGRHSLHSLAVELKRLGLRNRNRKPLTEDALSQLLNNPFYFGLIRIRNTGEVFQGLHPPIVSKALFDRVQAILRNHSNTRVIVHDFLFRRLIKCSHCKRSLTGELQKGTAYYRCHTRDCVSTSIREDSIDTEIRRCLDPLKFSDREWTQLGYALKELTLTWSTEKDTATKTVDMQLAALQERLARLTDAYIDRLIDKPTFEERQAATLKERSSLQERRDFVLKNGDSLPDQLRDMFELANVANTMYEMGIPEEKRDLITIVSSNRTASGKHVVVELSNPFLMIAKRGDLLNCGPSPGVLRTFEVMLKDISDYLKNESTEKFEVVRELLTDYTQHDDAVTRDASAA